MLTGAATPLTKALDPLKYELKPVAHAVVRWRLSPRPAHVPGNIEHCSDTALRSKYTQIRPGGR